MGEKGSLQNKTYWSTLRKDIARQKWIYILIAVPLIYYFVFKYVPLWYSQTGCCHSPYPDTFP